MLIQSGEVMVNGVWETRRRRKLFPGDSIELLGTKVTVVADGDSQ
jgi:ribosome-associated protein YbcJ (S4-like RNA binding protein)